MQRVEIAYRVALVVVWSAALIVAGLYVFYIPQTGPGTSGHDSLWGEILRTPMPMCGLEEPGADCAEL